MSSSNHARTASYSTRRSTATAETTIERPRPTSGTSSNNKDKTTKNIRSNLSPQSPPGSSQPRRSVSNSQKPNGESREQRERRTERVNVTTREYVTLRTKSPVREPSQSETRSREWERSKQIHRGSIPSWIGIKVENEQAESSSNPLLNRS